MGHLYYGNSADPIDIPDRLLAHLKVVVATKLRRSESFTLSWRHPEDIPGGRTTIWMQPSIPLRFVFHTESDGALDRDVLTRLAMASNSSAGLFVELDMLDEPVAAKAGVLAA